MSLHTARGIRAHGECLAGGEKLVADLLRESAAEATAWITTPALPGPPADRPDLPCIRLESARFRELNVFGVPGPLLALRTPPLPAFDPAAPWPAGCTLFIPFGDPDNVGAALRAAAGLGAARAVLTREAACPFLPKSVRASAGTVWKIPLWAGPALADVAAGAGPLLFALDLHGAALESVRPPERYGLVPGLEGQGVPDPLRRRCERVSIAMTRGVESLNAAAATAVALWAWRRPPG